VVVGGFVVGVVPPGVVVVGVVVDADAVTVNVRGVYQVLSEGNVSVMQSAPTTARRPAVASAGTLKDPCQDPFW
jgi:hypothetical protein